MIVVGYLLGQHFTFSADSAVLGRNVSVLDPGSVQGMNDKYSDHIPPISPKKIDPYIDTSLSGALERLHVCDVIQTVTTNSSFLMECNYCNPGEDTSKNITHLRGEIDECVEVHTLNNVLIMENTHTHSTL